METPKVFTLMVVSKTPDEVVKKYDKSLEVEPYVKFSYKDMSKYRKTAIKSIEGILSNGCKGWVTEFIYNYFDEKLKVLSKMTDFEYYTMIASGCSFNTDGDALSTENPNGKWSTCRLGRNIGIPFVLKSGVTSLQALAGDVDWEKMHMVNIEQYEAAWELFHGEREPETEMDRTIYENVKDKKRYFEGFKTKEDYVTYSCSYWCYAYADDNKWKWADDHKDIDWITEFYDKYVKALKPDDLVTLYECSM